LLDVFGAGLLVSKQKDTELAGLMEMGLKAAALIGLIA
jgi:hypothetical protein